MEAGLEVAADLSEAGDFAGALALLGGRGASARAAALRGWCLENLGRPNEAAAAYRVALRIDPAHLEALEGLANVLWSLGEEEGAARRWLAVVEAVALAERPSAREFELAGWSLYRLGRLEEAEQALRRAVALDQSAPSNRFDLGLVLLARGKEEAARAEYGRAIALSWGGSEGAIAVALDDLLQASLDPSVVDPIAQMLGGTTAPAAREEA